MDPYLALGIANSGVQAANSGGNILSQWLYGKRNEQWAREDATTAFERQGSLLSRMQNYDSPVEQMRRYVAAGLNPNLIYSQLQNGPAAPSVGQANSFSGSFSPVSTAGLQPILDAKLTEAQINRIENQNSNDSAITSAKVKEIYGETPVSQATISNLIATSFSSYCSGLKTMKDIDLISREITAKDIENRFNVQTFDTRVRSLQAQMNIDETNAKNLQKILDATEKDLLASSNLKDKQAKKALSDIDLNNSYINLNDKELKVKEALIAYYNSLGSQADANAALINLQKTLEDEFGRDIRASEVLHNIMIGQGQGLQRFGTSEFNRFKKNRLKN